MARRASRPTRHGSDPRPIRLVQRLHAGLCVEILEAFRAPASLASVVEREAMVATGGPALTTAYDAFTIARREYGTRTIRHTALDEGEDVGEADGH